ncbi:hypothetical protein [Chondrinema litorale]|uniref:hypothetical protein n=1 Tax=Chondrinema litorale TaxID=2994555 RepID=UPI002542F01C|nr:hypothetical protein [Chondrinema litorale]UZR94457.1 hypothetical protein OQ292_01320 [Chondrinema litorale]
MIISCSETPEVSPTQANTKVIEPYNGVDEKLWIYFNRFEEEALKRSIQVDLRFAGITGEIIDLEEEHVAGKCRFNPLRQSHLEIDLTYWNSSSDKNKEFVIFHELGHCYLFRDHREALNNDGTCISLMRSGIGECTDNYNANTRAVYIDELFNEEFTGELLSK